MVEIFKKHGISVFIFIIVIGLLFFHFTKYKNINEEVLKKQSKLKQDLQKRYQKSDNLLIEGGQVFILEGKQKEKYLAYKKQINKKKYDKKKINHKDVKKDSNTVFAQKVMKSIPYKLKKRKNIFEPFYFNTLINSDKKNKDKLFIYKGFYWFGNKKVAIFKVKKDLFYARVNELIGNSNYIVKSIEANSTIIKNINNSQEFKLVLDRGGNK